MRRPASASAVLWGEPISTRSCPNSAFRMRRPTMAGRSERTTVSTSGSSGNIDQDLAALHANRIDRDREGAVEYAFAGARVELPHMPGTGDHAIVQRAFAQRAALMRADPGKRSHLTADVAQSVLQSVAIHFHERSGRKLRSVSEFRPRHVRVPCGTAGAEVCPGVGVPEVGVPEEAVLWVAARRAHLRMDAGQTDGEVRLFSEDGLRAEDGLPAEGGLRAEGGPLARGH